MRRIAAVGVAVVFAGCAPKAETPEQADARIATESAAARQAIEAANAEFVQHFNQAHGDIVSQAYAEDGMLAVVNAPVAKGRQAIAKMVSDLAPMKATLILATESVAANGPLAVERGTYSLTMTPPGAPGPVTENGTFLVHWHKVGDRWLRVDDVATSDKPIPAPPEAPPAK
jgi:ketosteroid isomerase-like protein